MSAVAFPPEYLLAAWNELERRDYATLSLDSAGRPMIDLTYDGRDWILLAIWVRIGCPGFPQEWYESVKQQ